LGQKFYKGLALETGFSAKKKRLCTVILQDMFGFLEQLFPQLMCNPIRSYSSIIRSVVGKWLVGTGRDIG
jgi:hypothetical protein